jgi:uncharacterized protein YndB with AHSA1/START domain
MGAQRMSEMVLTKTVTVPLAVEDAFRLYTEGIATWWPVSTHSVEKEEAETVTFEPGEGGRIYEQTKSGDEHLWGTVLTWDPPSRIVHSWYPSRGEDTAQEVEITFERAGSGTRLELVHTGWETLGDQAVEVYGNYETGWDYVLGRYVERAHA